jgi:hypothetical protein
MWRWSLSLFVLVSLVVMQPATGQGQIFNGPPLGYTVSTLSGSVWGPMGVTPWFDTVFPTCAGGPDFQVTMAIPKEGVWALSSGYQPGAPLAWQMASIEELTAPFGAPVSMVVRAVEYSQWEDIYYASLAKLPPFDMTSVIVEFDRFGEARFVLSADEMANYVTDRLDPIFIEAAPDGTIWVTVDGTPLTILHVDPEAAEGSRVLGAITAPAVAAQFPHLTGIDDPRNLGFSATADDQGRLFVVAHVYDDFPGTPRIGLFRIDVDGSITDMAAADGESPPWDLPSPSLARGIHWDPDTGLLVGMGAGIHFFNPDRPGWKNSLVSELDLSSYVAGDAPSENSGPVSICSGPTSFQGANAFLAVRDYVYYYFRYDLDLIDIDKDLLTGAEEARLGTDELLEDSDGGGISDGAERLDYTSPTDGADDRILDSPSDNVTMAPLSVGSEAWSEIKKGIRRQVLAHPSGELRLTTWALDLANERMYRWRGPDVPAWMGVQKATETDMHMDGEGFAYAYWPQWGIVKLAPPGADAPGVEAIVDLDELQALVGGPFPFSAISVTPEGQVYAAFGEGKLIHVDPAGKLELLYDAEVDLVLAGLKEGAFCTGTSCTCDGTIGPITYEPIRGVTYFWVMLDIYCGNYQAAMSAVLVAILPEGGLKYVGHGVLFEETEAMYGALAPRDMEPDMSGGLWVLGTSGLDRLFYRIDSNYQAHSHNILSTPIGVAATTTAFAHGDNLAVSPDGRLYFMPTHYYNQYPSEFMLTELISVEPVVQAGDFLLTSPEDSKLGRLLPLGGGISLLDETVLETPEGVAATEELVVVTDSGRSAVGFISVDEFGKLQDVDWRGTLNHPEGVDIDAQGRAVVAESGGARVVRIDRDGATETLLEGDPLVSPRDVVCLHDGGFMVADAGANRIIHVGPDGTTETFAVTDAPVSLAIAADTLYFSSSNAGSPYAFKRSPGGIDPLGDNASFPPRAGYNIPGGIAVGTDGSVVWLVQTSGAYDKPTDSRFEPTATETYPIRFNPRGYATVMVRNGMGPHTDPGDVTLARKVGASLPARPVVNPEDSGPNGDNIGGSEVFSGPECSSDDGCSAGSKASGVSLLLLCVLLAMLLVLRVGRRSLPLLVALTLMGCGSKSACPDVTKAGDLQADGATAEDVVSVPSATQTAKPGDPVTFPTCEAPQCLPGTPPECLDGKSRQRCYQGPDGCPVWSPIQQCGEGEECVAGSCAICIPQCENRDCGDDGCGGVCGECDSEWCCQGSTCTLCEPQCDGKVCGPDWAGGSCGECEGSAVCAAGDCRQADVGNCVELNDCLNDCPEWDHNCWELCFEFASKYGFYRFQELAECTMVMCLHCWDGDDANEEGDQCYQDCLQNDCLHEFAVCTLFDGHLSCAEAYDCLESCTGTDEECSAECIEVMTVPAYEAAMAWEQCMLPICPDELGEEAQETCKAEVAEDECAEVYAGCFGPCEPWCAPQQVCGSNMCTGICGICPEGTWCGNGMECMPLR